jgi:DNA processing protein
MQNKTDHVLSWIGLSSIPGVGRATFRKLVRLFGSAERSLAASPGELQDIEGLSSKVVGAFGAFDWRMPAEREVAKAKETGVAIITLDDPSYPKKLRDTPDPPLYLYIRGGLAPEDDNAVAIVGTRRPTHYGKTVTQRLARELAASGLTVVSGLARGIDTEAHLGALAADGRTIAVLGCGIDVAYPPENRGLIDRISRSGRGAVITENPFGTKPEAGYFPARNRIISGLSRGTVIIEASEDSGSLITAQYAREQDRKLFAVPGNIASPVSRGAHSLIKQGATLVEGVRDVLAGLGENAGRAHREPAARPLPQLSPGEAAVLQSLSDEPKHIDALLQESRMTAGALSGALITLELKGLAKQLPGKYFVRTEM